MAIRIRGLIWLIMFSTMVIAVATSVGESGTTACTGHGESVGDMNQDSNKPIVLDRTFNIDKHYLNFPVKNGATPHLIRFIIDNKILREFYIELAPEKPDFWVFLDTTAFKGETACVRIDAYTQGFDRIFQADTFPGQENLYKEKLRPQFHLSSQRGWNNDINGTVYYDGEYHIFWQHNPYGWSAGNTTWCQAVSKDLLHWTELGEAIHPDNLGTIWSGSAVVDEKNTAGFQAGSKKPIVCFYTSAGGATPMAAGQSFTQSIAYSNDCGRSFEKYKNNPVLGHINGNNRDPKVFWYEPAGQWVMVLYIEDQTVAFLTSADLKSWKLESKLKSFHECPELFPLPLDGNNNNQKWILHGGSGDYMIGRFNGREFKPESEPVRYNYGSSFFASQTFNNMPKKDDRRIQVGWGPVVMPDMPFNQMVLFPVTLTLRTTDEGPRLFSEPVKEIEKLHKNIHKWKSHRLKAGENLLSKINGELFHIKTEIKPDTAQEFGFIIRGVPVVYDVKKQELSCSGKTVTVKPVDGKICLELLVDRTSIEIFVNNGRFYMPMGVILVDNPDTLKIFAKGGDAFVKTLEVAQLKSIW
jgi:fructan beta-fructosidase